MTTTTISGRLPLPNEALLFDLEALYRCLQMVADQRSRQGLRYPLASILMIGVLTKLAGQDSSRAIAHWAQLRKQELRLLFTFKCEKMPHYSTWSRVLGRGVDPNELERALGDFFASSLAEGNRLQRGGLQVCLDGKTLRGTIPLGQSQGVHLLAASPATISRDGRICGDVPQGAGPDVSAKATAVSRDPMGRRGGHSI